MKTIREAATDLCDRWETKLWKDVEHTAVFIHELRMALAQPDEQQSCDRRKWVELSVTDIDNITHKAIGIVDAMLLTEETLKELNK